MIRDCVKVVQFYKSARVIRDHVRGRVSLCSEAAEAWCKSSDELFKTWCLGVIRARVELDCKFVSRGGFFPFGFPCKNLCVTCAC